MSKNQTPNFNLSAITPLHSLHIELGAKLVTFAGYEMPLQYPTGIIAEHLHTRTQIGLFDISHMGQIKLTGTNVADGLETIVPTDIVGLPSSRQRYTLFTNIDGGILDDLIVTNLEGEYQLIVNAACKQSDYKHLKDSISDYCKIEMLADQALLALQGPRAREVLTKIVPAIGELNFMNAMQADIVGLSCLISCSGYTGEDGFEISIHSEQVEDLARLLLDQKDVLPIGLGARDSLRLEAGLCLYGHELTTETTPVEAGLTWVVSKSRRPEGERAGGYLGADRIDEQLARGTDRLRVGIVPEGKAPVREGTKLIDDKGQLVGTVTTGSYSPTLRRPIAMGYVASSLAVPDMRIYARVRDRLMPLTIVKLPFVSPRFYRN